MSTESVQVAVRVRPFMFYSGSDAYEVNTSNIIRFKKEQKGCLTYLKNPATGEEQRFDFDYGFDSSFNDPAAKGTGKHFDTQDDVWEAVGKDTMKAILEGKNACLFAYGQTGSGKTFSMLGDKRDGIVCRTCEEIFRRIDESKSDPNRTESLTLQVVEVYCELVHDLLAPKNEWQGGLRVRMLADGGYGVQSTIKQCKSMTDIAKAIDQADKQRAKGEHMQNKQSSRAHTIYTLVYHREHLVTSGEDQGTVKSTSKINIIDLAGAENTLEVGTSGQMQLEGNKILLSLLYLQRVITALAEGKKPDFKNSTLTKLLQKCMQDGKVILIAAMSPSSCNYEHTLATLKFASDCKKVQVKGTINVTRDPIAELTEKITQMEKQWQDEIKAKEEEIQRLKKENVAGTNQEIKRLQAIIEEQNNNVKDMKEDLKREKETLQKTEQDRDDDMKRIDSGWNQDEEDSGGPMVIPPSAGAEESAKKKCAVTVPHLRNIASAPELNGLLVYKLKKGLTAIGRKSAKGPMPHFVFSGLGVYANHCAFDWNEAENKVLLKITNPKAQVKVNGRLVKAATTPETKAEEGCCYASIELFHNDRVMIGVNYLFAFRFPGQEDKFEGENAEDMPDYETAISELKLDETADQPQHSSSTALPSDQGSKSDVQGEAVKPQPSFFGNNRKLLFKLNEAIKDVFQANAIVIDLDVNAKFTPRIVLDRNENKEVMIEAQLLNGETVTWTKNKFDNRLADMTNLWANWSQAQENGEEWSLPQTDEFNPFIDNDDSHYIGSAQVSLQALQNKFDDPDPFTVNLDDMYWQKIGTVTMKLRVLKDEGKPVTSIESSDALAVDNPEDLIGSKIFFRLEIIKVQFGMAAIGGKGQCRWRKVFSQFKMNLSEDVSSEDQLYCSSRAGEGEPDIRLDFSKDFSVVVTKAMIARFKEPVILKFFGELSSSSQRPVTPQQRPVTPSPPSAVPAGWKQITAFESPDGTLHKQLPASVSTLVPKPPAEASPNGKGRPGTGGTSLEAVVAERDSLKKHCVEQQQLIAQLNETIAELKKNKK